MGVNVILLLIYTIIHKKKCVTDRKHENNKVAGLFLLCKFRSTCIMKKLFFEVICKNVFFFTLLILKQGLHVNKFISCDLKIFIQ